MLNTLIHTTLTITINWGELDELLQKLLPVTLVESYYNCAATHGYIPTPSKLGYDELVSMLIWDKYGRRPVNFEWVAVRQHLGRGHVVTKEETFTSTTMVNWTQSEVHTHWEIYNALICDIVDNREVGKSVSHNDITLTVKKIDDDGEVYIQVAYKGDTLRTIPVESEFFCGQDELCEYMLVVASEGSYDPLA